MSTLTRRSFLKGAAAATLSVGAGSALDWLAPRPAWAASPNGTVLILLYLRGGADIGFQMVQPDLNSELSLPLNRVRPNIYDSAANPPLLTGTGYSAHRSFPILVNIHQANQLAILQRVGTPGSLGSHEEAERIVSLGLHSASASATLPWLARLKNTYLTNPADLLDLGGEMLLGTGTNALSLARLNQAISVNGTLDPVLFTRENGFRRDAFFRVMTSPGVPGSSFESSLQRAWGSINATHDTIRSNSVTVAGYAGTGPGLFFSQVEYALLLSQRASTFSPQVFVGSYEGSWDTHRLQAGAGSGFPAAVSALNAAVSNFRTRTLSTFWNNSIICVFSEMGRGSIENSLRGTDHGASGSVLFMGGKVKGGVYGTGHTAAEIGNGYSPIAPTTRWSDVFSELIAALGYDPAPIFPGVPRTPLGIFV